MAGRTGGITTTMASVPEEGATISSRGDVHALLVPLVEEHGELRFAQELGQRPRGVIEEAGQAELVGSGRGEAAELGGHLQIQPQAARAAATAAASGLYPRRPESLSASLSPSFS